MATHPIAITMSIPMTRLIRLAATGLTILVPLVASTGSPPPSYAQGVRHAVFLPTALRAAELGGLGADGDDASTWFSYVDSNAILDLAVDRRTGEVWAGTEGGAVRWDPATGTYTHLTMQDGLETNWVRFVSVDEAGGRWFFHSASDAPHTDNRRPAITRFGPEGDWQTVPVPNNVVIAGVSSMAARADGTLWLGTSEGGVYRRDPDNTWRVEPDAGCGFTYAIELDAAGIPWSASQCGARRLGPGSARTSWRDGERVYALALVGGGEEAWFGATDAAYHLRRDGQIETLTPADGLPAGSVRAIAVAADGAVWFRSEVALARRGPEAGWRLWTEQEGVPTGTNGAMVADAASNAWLMTDGSSSLRLLHVIAPDGTVRHPRTALGPFGRYFYAVHIDRSGNRWFGSTQGGLSRLTADGRWETVTAPDDRPGDIASSGVLDIAEDEDGNLWLATAVGLRRRSADGAWQTYAVSPDWSPNDWVKAVLPDRDGSVWFGTNLGAGRLMQDGSVQVVDLPPPMTSRYVMAIRVDAQDNRWFATREGLARLAPDGSWRVLTVDEGLPNWFTTDVAPDDTGGAWVATGGNPGGGGLTYVAADGTLTTWRARDGVLASDHVFSVHRTPEGGLWVGTRGGVSFRAPDGRWTVYRNSPEARLGDIMDFAVDAAGDVWMTDLTGVVWRFRPGASGADCASASASPKWTRLTRAP